MAALLLLLELDDLVLLIAVPPPRDLEEFMLMLLFNPPCSCIHLPNSYGEFVMVDVIFLHFDFALIKSRYV